MGCIWNHNVGCAFANIHFPLVIILSRRLLTNIVIILFHLCLWHSIYIKFNLQIVFKDETAYFEPHCALSANLLLSYGVFFGPKDPRNEAAGQATEWSELNG